MTLKYRENSAVAASDAWLILQHRHTVPILCCKNCEARDPYRLKPQIGFAAPLHRIAVPLPGVRQRQGHFHYPLSITLAAWPAEEVLLNKSNTVAATAAVKPRERDEADRRPDKTWKPYPCLLTRRELQELVAEQLG